MLFNSRQFEGRKAVETCLRSLLAPQCAWVEKLGSSPQHTNCVFLIALALAVYHQPPVFMVFPSCVATTTPS